MKRQNYDERQLLARSRAFQYAFFTFAGTVIVWEFLCGLLGFAADPFGELWLLLTPTFLVFAITCIVRDAYDPIQSRPGMIVFAVWPISALIVLIDKLCDRTVMIDGKCITDDGGMMILEIGVLIISAIYWICYFRSGREAEED